MSIYHYWPSFKFKPCKNPNIIPGTIIINLYGEPLIVLSVEKETKSEIIVQILTPTLNIRLFRGMKNSFAIFVATSPEL
jgi:hypothetical protein